MKGERKKAEIKHNTTNLITEIGRCRPSVLGEHDNPKWIKCIIGTMFEP